MKTYAHFWFFRKHEIVVYSNGDRDFDIVGLKFHSFGKFSTELCLIVVVDIVICAFRCLNGYRHRNG